jgi:membrane protease YdiL (CAAX protease family)
MNRNARRNFRAFSILTPYQHSYGILLTTCLGIFFGVVYLALRRNLWVVVLGHGVYEAGHALYLSTVFAR